MVILYDCIYTHYYLWFHVRSLKIQITTTSYISFFVGSKIHSGIDKPTSYSDYKLCFSTNMMKKLTYDHLNDDPSLKRNLSVFLCGKAFSGTCQILNLQDFKAARWKRFNPSHRTDNRGLLCLQESSNSNCLFQKTFSYKVCSKDAKLQISLNLLIAWLWICMWLYWGPNEINGHQQVHAFIYWRKTA